MKDHGLLILVPEIARFMVTRLQSWRSRAPVTSLTMRDGEDVMPGQWVSPALLVAGAFAVLAGVFAVLRVLAWSRRRSPAAANRHWSEAYDWRTLPPKDEGDAMLVTDAEEYGPLWRYGVPMGYGRVYDPGHDRGDNPS